MALVIRLNLWMIARLTALAAWLDPPQPIVVVAVEPDPVLAIAQVLTQAVDGKDMSGEAKRHQVYAALIKTFPEVAKRRLSRAIEDALSTSAMHGLST